MDVECIHVYGARQSRLRVLYGAIQGAAAITGRTNTRQLRSSSRRVREQSVTRGTRGQRRPQAGKRGGRSGRTCCRSRSRRPRGRSRRSRPPVSAPAATSRTRRAWRAARAWWARRARRRTRRPRTCPRRSATRLLPHPRGACARRARAPFQCMLEPRCQSQLGRNVCQSAGRTRGCVGKWGHD